MMLDTNENGITTCQNLGTQEKQNTEETVEQPMPKSRVECSLPNNLPLPLKEVDK
jgi:hypothetical protein